MKLDTRRPAASKGVNLVPTTRTALAERDLDNCAMLDRARATAIRQARDHAHRGAFTRLSGTKLDESPGDHDHRETQTFSSKGTFPGLQV